MKIDVNILADKKLRMEMLHHFYFVNLAQKEKQKEMDACQTLGNTQTDLGPFRFLNHVMFL